MSAAPTTTDDAAVVMTLDSSRQVSGIAIPALPDALRSPEGLVSALRRAYLDAVEGRIDERLGRTPRAEGEKPVAVATPTPRPATSETFGHVPHDELVEFWRRPVAEPTRVGSREVGVSDNQCVHVVLHRSDHFADIDLDPGWLRTARVSSVATAVLEAFEDAYSQRNQR